ncbi:phosphoribosylformylglycinamidine synthase [Clostridium algidicarnis]|uniref:phosphoribosylformylglycinamidine synthase n=1 Tax=Clostridium algidicarnis TaxID=37659 RepID=UPI001CF2EA7F|nr:phosphoribosylformylglycinamidine synthase [Clostridium algidicarnis]MCB2285892.1 phosphoribosylformylglycinamidine synthase [Clostridium algidicarnis]
MNTKNIFVEKKSQYNLEGKKLLEEFIMILRINSIEEVRIINGYSIRGISEDVYNKSKYTIFAEKNIDNLYEDKSFINEDYTYIGREYLKGQFDQRADAAKECVEILSEGERPSIRCFKILEIKGSLTKDEIQKIKKHYINPVDSKEFNIFKDVNLKEEKEENEVKTEKEIIKDFINLKGVELEDFYRKSNMAMTRDDLGVCLEHFKKENRNPTYTEMAVIDTYWSDHCRHTTFSTAIKNIEIEDGIYTEPIKIAFDEYKEMRNLLKREDKDITMMEIATIAMREMKEKGLLKDLDESDEINACTIKVDINTENGIEKYLILFKNETHNHPTEIEPFGGAATCLGGAIRDPLSGRAYVYQAMRVTGSGDPRGDIEKTLKGKLPQRTITLGAANGYSSYGNQIGIATGQVEEIYHEGFIAKRMEIGAVIGAAPFSNVIREEPILGDVIVLLGGRTGRDGCGGATGSSKEHTENSIEYCGAEVQKGNAPVERKIQRLFKNPKVSKIIKRCNDFGAGGVSVAIGELSESIDIYLDKVPKKYEGLEVTEIAISESQERMAVVVSNENLECFVKFALEENLEATMVAKITDNNRLRMLYKDEVFVDLDRSFLDSNGAKSYADVLIKAPKEKSYLDSYKLDNNPKDTLEDIESERFNFKCEESFKDTLIEVLEDLNVCSKKGLVERFDSTVGAGTVLMPYGGVFERTPSEGMVSKIPLTKGHSDSVSLMTFGYNPKISEWSPFHGAYFAVIESVTKIVALGGDYKNIKLTLQEYFEKLYEDKVRWGKPFSALLGALYAQKQLGIAAIGGKDSMSGTFEDISVPPTLVSFAVAIEPHYKEVMSQNFKEANSKVILIKTPMNKDKTLNIQVLKSNFESIKKLNNKNLILSAMSIKQGGALEAICKMSFGNEVGISFQDISKEELLHKSYGSIVIEVKDDEEVLKILTPNNYKIIGTTTDNSSIEGFGEKISLKDLIKHWESPLESIFETKTKKEELFEGCFKEKSSAANVKDNKYTKTYNSLNISVPKPRVFIPVFPGTNCEEDSRNAFEKAGAIVNERVFKNITEGLIKESIKEMTKEIKQCEIIMIPGGFSAGDEPEGSGKFISTVFRNPYIKEAVMELLNKRDGLMIGICNGFQALIKLGLVPYGEILDIEENMPTLTYNSIGRHVSTMVRTKIVSNNSPWLQETKIGDIHTLPVSHGEGRFVAPRKVIEDLFKNGQVATQYVDRLGNPSMEMNYNPNGSLGAIEGILSPDGRVFGKMAHSERIGEGLYKNIEGNMDQKIFKSGVNYFK